MTGPPERRPKTVGRPPSSDAALLDAVAAVAVVAVVVAVAAVDV